MTTDIDTKEVALVRTQATKSVAAAQGIAIRKADDLPAATDVLSKIKKVQKMISEKKLSITRPINEALKQVRGLFAPIEADVDSAEEIIKEKMLAFQLAEEKRLTKKTDTITKQVDEGKLSFEAGAAKIEKAGEVHTSTTGAVGSVSTRIVNEVVIKDVALVPREYLVPDMVKIRYAALAGTVIAGVEVLEKKVIAAR